MQSKKEKNKTNRGCLRGKEKSKTNNAKKIM